MFVNFHMQLYLIDKTDVSWWSMRSQSGSQGLVPVNYIDKLDTDQEQQATDSLIDHAHSNGSMDNGVSLVHLYARS